jgi:hypothetical protein
MDMKLEHASIRIDGKCRKEKCRKYKVKTECRKKRYVKGEHRKEGV